MQQIQISPDQTIIISRQNAAAFHNQVKERIKETGEGLFEYLETLKFMEKLQEAIDQEFKDMARTEIIKYGKDGFTTQRGAKFNIAEVGTKYDFLACGDPEYDRLDAELKGLQAKIKERQEFLKTIPANGVDIIFDGGEVCHVNRPNKTSISSYRITLPS